MRSCEYCEELFEPKRKDSLYCSASCRQMAYLSRKANPAPGPQDLKLSTVNKSNGLMDKPIYLSMESRDLTGNDQEPPGTSLKEQDLTAIQDYPSIDGTKNGDPSIKSVEKVLEPCCSSVELSIENLSVNEEPVNKNPKPSTDPSSRPEKEYIDKPSSFLWELTDLVNERNNVSRLLDIFIARCQTSPWVTTRYKCLTECLLTFSEMKSIELDDLKRVCNAFTDLCQSIYFKHLPAKYPYTNEILEWRETLKKTCLEADESEPLRFRLKKETRHRLLASRSELSYFAVKVPFMKLNFKDQIQ